jgi:hypothetical protein
MPPQTRREFLKQTGAGVATAAALPVVTNLAQAAQRKTGVSPAQTIPPHRALALAGVHAYADQESVAAGSEIAFHVSSTVAYRISICRLGLKVDDPAGDIVLHEFPNRRQKHNRFIPGPTFTSRNRCATN